MEREKSCEKISEGNVKMLCNVRQRMWWNENRKLKGGTEWKRRKGRKGGRDENIRKHMLLHLGKHFC